MMAEPADNPFTVPVDETEATAALLLDHEPPEIVEDNVDECPLQIAVAPESAPALGKGFTENEKPVVAVPHAFVTE